MELQIATTALIIGVVSWMGINVFDDMEWEGVASLCAAILVICGVVFMVSFLSWIWGW